MKHFLPFSPDIVRPLMQSKEVAIIIEILKRKNPKRVLEWGAGYSTIFFSRYLSSEAKWIAVEHDKEWYIRIKRLVYDPKIMIFYVPPNHIPWTDPYEDGSFSDLRDYVKFPEKLNEKFDLIIIDGRARKFCLIHALKFLKNDGIVILHDSNRKYYHEPFKLYNYQVLFKDSRQVAGGIWIGSKTLDPKCILNIRKHKLNWKIMELFRPIWYISSIRHSRRIIHVQRT